MDLIEKNLQAYAEKFTQPESDLLKEITRETHLKVLYPQMLSGHLQGRFLSMVSKMVKPSLILEIGTFTGYSAICLAEGLSEKGMLVTIDVNVEIEDYVRKNFKKAGIEDKVEFILGDAAAVMVERKFVPDLVFIDADKENYLKYYEGVLPNMPSGAMLLADNVLWSGRVIDPTVNDKETKSLRDFSNFVASDPRVETLLLPIRDGIMMVRKR